MSLACCYGLVRIGLGQPHQIGWLTSLNCLRFDGVDSPCQGLLKCPWPIADGSRNEMADGVTRREVFPSELSIAGVVPLEISLL